MGFFNLNNIFGKDEVYIKAEKTYQDVIARQDVDYVQTRSLEFTCSSIPQPEKSFFNEILQPVILISATIITVVLLFTVRSK